MAKKKVRAVYHTFKRRYQNPDGELEIFEVECRCKPGTTLAIIEVAAEGVRRALDLNGQADSQNCAGAVCLTRQKKAFNHPVMPLIDWWRRRVYIQDSPKTCRVYGHFDNIEELFDTDAGLRKLLKRIEKSGPIKVTLYPAKKGQDPRTGKPTKPGGPATIPGGEERKPRLVGNELRLLNHLSGRA